MATIQRSSTNGVLPVTATQTSGNAPKPISKPPAPRLKLIVRRLPPGLTEAEFTAIIGDDWSMAQGRIDWFLYKPGKDSKDPSKPSRPSRAYLRLTSDDHIPNLTDKIRQSVFEDAQNTFTNPCLLGQPPIAEFTLYGRTPGGRRRVDARAGTIDQDPEFMAFLEGLANPTGKDANTDGTEDGSPTTKEKVTTTPLVQYLKDKKATKSREAAVKAAKKQEANLAKNKNSKDSPEKKTKGDRVVEKAAKEAVRILNRETPGKAGTSSSVKSDISTAEGGGTSKPESGKHPARQSPSIAAHDKRRLQRELGLSPAQAHRQVKRDAADAQRAERLAAAEKATGDAKNASASTSSPVPTAPKGNAPQANSRRSRAKVDSEAKPSTPTAPMTPMILLKKPESTQATPSAPAPKPVPTAPARKPQPVAVPSAGATQAFIKHANPSQGVTESLLKEAMEKFGSVSMVEIDKRKGFAYVDFVESEGLKKAMAANPIPVAQGTVQVMQRKGTALPPEKKPAHPAPHQAPHQVPRGGRGGGRGGTVGRRGGRGAARGGGNSAPASAPTGPAPKG